MEVDLYNRMSELSKKYGKNHPQMVAINSELADLKKRKALEAQQVVNSLKNEYRLSVAKEESLKKALTRQKEESLELNKKAVQFGVLKRQAESARQMYELLIKRFKETSLTEEMKTGNIRIIDQAEVPTEAGQAPQKTESSPGGDGGALPRYRPGVLAGIHGQHHQTAGRCHELSQGPVSGSGARIYHEPEFGRYPNGADFCSLPEVNRQ